VTLRAAPAHRGRRLSRGAARRHPLSSSSWSPFTSFTCSRDAALPACRRALGSLDFGHHAVASPSRHLLGLLRLQTADGRTEHRFFDAHVQLEVLRELTQELAPLVSPPRLIAPVIPGSWAHDRINRAMINCATPAPWTGRGAELRTRGDGAEGWRATRRQSFAAATGGSSRFSLAGGLALVPGAVQYQHVWVCAITAGVMSLVHRGHTYPPVSVRGSQRIR
jgi:hypothetical protein